MSYVPLGARPVVAIPDTTGLNPGNWTARVGHELIQATVPVFELYHLYLTAPTLPGTATRATVLLNLHSWDVTLLGQANSWDPSQPMLLQPGDDLHVMFNVPTTTNPPPQVTAWFRYQPT
jgi:hypothetical protein